MDRRDFLKTAGIGAASLGLAGCNNSSRGHSADSIEGTMEYRTNPKTGDKVSLLGYGCMRWPMIKDQDGNDIVDQERVNELVDYAIEHGVNFFDSSPVYLQGQSERATAIALRRHPRESYFISTKMSNFQDCSLETSIAMYKASLRNYETEVIDYYLLHALSGGADLHRRFIDNGLLDYLMEERRLGHIRNLGLSFHGTKEGFDEIMEAHETYHWDFALIQMNYVDWKHMEDKAGTRRKEVNAEYPYGELVQRGIPVLVMEPLLGGRLAKLPEAVEERLSSLDAKRSTASWAFRFLGTLPGVMCTLSGMTYKENLVDNLKTFSNFKPLSDKEKEVLESVAKMLTTYNTVDCTGCQYCMPCPYGINIPGIFSHYNKCVNEGIMPDPKEELEDSEERKAFRKARREYLISYDRAIPTIRQADHCIGCGACVSKCPQGIIIPQQLHRIDRYINNLKKTR